MVEFETVKSDEVSFGANNFLEIARKKAKTEEGENEFISVSRGFVDKMGNRRYRKSVSVPLVAEVVEFAASTIKAMGEGAPAAAEVKKEEVKEEKTEEAAE